MAFEPDIHVVEQIGSGFLAVMPKPTTGEWIEDEFANISAFGIKKVVSLLEPDEAEDFGLGDEQALCERNGMRFISYPIRDRGLPASLPDFARFTHEIYEATGSGTSTVIHCLAGIGRSGTVAAGVLLHAAFEADAAFAHISAARGMSVPDTEEQRRWLIEHQHEIRNTEQAPGDQTLPRHESKDD
ncbi:MAG: dual specificity protein phosphatase family protein [Verrucomicrobiota bacterium]